MMDTARRMPRTSTEDLEQAIKTLRSNADRFLKLSIQERIDLLKRMLEGSQRVAEASVRAACEAKGLSFDEPVSGEEWLAGPVLIIRNLRLLIDTLTQIHRNGAPKVPAVKTLPHGQTAVKVFPTSTLDAMVFTGFEGWCWMEPEVTPANLPQHMAVHYQNPPARGKVSLVLGAGNVASIASMDALYKMFTELEVVLIKMNPVNEYLGPFIEEAFKAAVDQGFLKVVYGGGDVGAFLVNHPEIDDVHITGSDETHDLIVWGPPGPERERRRAAGEPLLNKPITSELGNVSPVVVVPAKFSDRELDFQAENVAAMLTNNGGFNCNAAKVLVLSQGWEQREQFVKAVSEKLAGIPPRKAYYPGARERHSAFVQGHDKVELIGAAGPDELPWALLRGLDPDDQNEICFRKEAFCSILGETALKSTTPVEFLAEATRFCNERMWGTLNLTLVVHPSIEADPASKAALEQAIRELRYGTIAINHWAALGYGFVSTPWGGYSGTSLENIQSGRGWVHNTYMLENIQKSVIKGPIVVSPRPAWFRTNRNTHNIARKMTGFEASPSVMKLPGLVMQALKG